MERKEGSGEVIMEKRMVWQCKVIGDAQEYMRQGILFARYRIVPIFAFGTLLSDQLRTARPCFMENGTNWCDLDSIANKTQRPLLTAADPTM